MAEFNLDLLFKETLAGHKMADLIVMAHKLLMGNEGNPDFSKFTHKFSEEEPFFTRYDLCDVTGVYGFGNYLLDCGAVNDNDVALAFNIAYIRNRVWDVFFIVAMHKADGETVDELKVKEALANYAYTNDIAGSIAMLS